MGIGLLALLIGRRGDPGFSTIASGLLVLGLVLAILEGTFQASVTVWAGNRWEVSNELPALYEQLRLWLNLWLQRVWVPMALVASIGIGLAGVRYGVLSPWVGWPGIAVSGVVLIQMITAGAVIVALAFVPLFLFGAALLIFGWSQPAAKERQPGRRRLWARPGSCPRLPVNNKRKTIAEPTTRPRIRAR